jgi:hypothetical protein
MAAPAIAAVVWLAGCAPPPPPPFQTWVELGTPYRPQVRSNNAFDGYALAAERAEQLCPESLDRVFFTPGMESRILNRLGATLRALEEASQKSCQFEFRPIRPFEAPAFQRGWRLLGRALCWRIRDAIAIRNYDAAIRIAGVAMRFGFHLTGGGASDASLGFAIVNDARQTLCPALVDLSPDQLERLSSQTVRALRERPPLSRTLQHERLNMLAAVQYVQDAHRMGDYSELNQKLGPLAQPVIRQLQQLADKGADERIRYFRGFAAEADDEVAWVAKQAVRLAWQRSPAPEPEGERPWRRLAQSFFGTASHLPALSDRCVAQTRLLALHAMAIAAIKRTGNAPSSITSLAEDLVRDPYSGRPFVYAADRSDFRLYSVGEDGQDNGGESDESHLRPDVTLEIGTP